MNPNQLIISNKLREVAKLPDFLEQYCAAVSVPPTMILSLNLAIEEALVNCVQYAYPKGTTGKVALQLAWNEPLHELQFTLRDSGTPFNPLAMPEPDITLSDEERPIGGLGILLVRKIMDRITYQRNGQDNILTMYKKIPSDSTL